MILSGPILHQYFVQQPLEFICKQFPEYIIYHYIDDILLADSDLDFLEKMLYEVKKILLC